MADALSFAEIDGQHVELLPTRTVLGTFGPTSAGMSAAPGTAGGCTSSVDDSAGKGTDGVGKGAGTGTGGAGGHAEQRLIVNGGVSCHNQDASGGNGIGDSVRR